MQESFFWIALWVTNPTTEEKMDLLPLFVILNDLERNPCSWLGISLGTIASRFFHEHGEMGRFRAHNSKRGDVKKRNSLFLPRIKTV